MPAPDDGLRRSEPAGLHVVVEPQQRLRGVRTVGAELVEVVHGNVVRKPQRDSVGLTRPRRRHRGVVPTGHAVVSPGLAVERGTVTGRPVLQNEGHKVAGPGRVLPARPSEDAMPRLAPVKDDLLAAGGARSDGHQGAAGTRPVEGGVHAPRAVALDHGRSEAGRDRVREAVSVGQPKLVALGVSRGSVAHGDHRR